MTTGTAAAVAPIRALAYLARLISHSAWAKASESSDPATCEKMAAVERAMQGAATTLDQRAWVDLTGGSRSEARERFAALLTEHIPASEDRPDVTALEGPVAMLLAELEKAGGQENDVRRLARIGEAQALVQEALDSLAIADGTRLAGHSARSISHPFALLLALLIRERPG